MCLGAVIVRRFVESEKRMPTSAASCTGDQMWATSRSAVHEPKKYPGPR